MAKKESICGLEQLNAGNANWDVILAVVSGGGGGGGGGGVEGGGSK